MAGLDAGHAYNEFPLMGGQLIPAEYWALPGWRNFFENTAAVQFDHRLLATTTLLSVAATWLGHRAAPLPASSKRLLHALMAVTAAQVGSQDAVCLVSRASWLDRHVVVSYPAIVPVVLSRSSAGFLLFDTQPCRNRFEAE